MRWTVTPSEGRTLTAVTQEKHLLHLCFDLFCRFFWIFFFCVSFIFLSVVVVDFLALLNLIKLLSFFFFLSHIFFIAVINLCLYIGLLQFCVFFPFFLFSSFNFNIFKPIIFSYIYSFFCFSYCSFPLAANL